MAGVAGDRSPFRVASLCVKADKALYKEHRILMRSRRLERRLRLETSFLKYKLALLRKQRGERNVNILEECKRSENPPAVIHSRKFETTYMAADSDSEDSGDLNEINSTPLNPEESQGAPASTQKTLAIPKRPTNGYLCFCAQMRPLILKKTSPLKQQEMQRVLSHVWKEMPYNLKKHYYEMYEKDKLRYKQQMKIYNALMDDDQGVQESEVLEQFTMPNYLMEVPAFLPHLVNSALVRDETGYVNIDRDVIHEISAELKEDEDMPTAPGH